MDGKLPPWNIHGAYSSSIPYTSGECHEARDLTGESMPSLSSCMSGAFRTLLPDYHGTSSAMTANPVKYSYSPDDHCVIRSGTGMSYAENTIERREKFNYIKDSLVYPKYTQYVPQEKDRELDQGNSHNWTSVIKHALEMSNGMEMEQTVDVCSPLVDFNPVYKEPQMEVTRSKPNEKQDGLEAKGEHNSFIAMLSDGISKQQNVQEMAVNQESDIFTKGSSLRKGEPRMTVIRGHEPGFSLPGFYSSHNPHLLEGYMTCDEFSLVKQPSEHTSQKTPQEPGLSCQVGSPKKPQESHTTSCFGVNNEIVSDSSPVFDLHNLDLPKYSLPSEVMDGNSHHYPSNYNDQQEMGHQSHLHVSNTTHGKHFKNQVTTSPIEEGTVSNLSIPEEIETQGSVHTKNTELSLKLEAKFVPEIVTFSNPDSSPDSLKLFSNPNSSPDSQKLFSNPNSSPGSQKLFSNPNSSPDSQKLFSNPNSSPDSQKLFSNPNSSPDSQKLPEQPAFSHKMYIDDTCKDSQQGQGERINKLCFQENNLKSRTVTTSPVCVDGRTDLLFQEKQSPANQSLVLIPSGHSKMCEQTFLNNGEESSNHSTPHNLENALQKYQEKKPRKIAKKPRKRKKTELEELIEQTHKSTKISDCSLYESDISDGAVKPDKTGCEEVNDICPLTDHDISALEEDTINKNDNVLPRRKKTTPKKSKIEGDCITRSCYAAEYQCVSQLQSLHEQSDTTETSQKPGHSSENSCEKATSNVGNSRQKDNKKKTSIRKTVYGRKRKKVSKIHSKATYSNQNNVSFTSHSQVTLLEANADVNEAQSSSGNQQTISNLQSLDDEYNPEISKKSRRKKSNDAQHTLQSKGDLPSQLEGVSSLFEADQVDYKIKKLQKARRPSIKTFGDKNDKNATILDEESLIDSVSPTDSVSTSPNIRRPQKNPRKPRQKKRVDVSKIAETLNASPAVLQEKDATSPLTRHKEIMETTKKTRPVKAKRHVKRPSRKNQNEDHETTVLDIQTFTGTLKQDSVSVAGSEVESPVVLRTRKTFAKKASPKTVSDETDHLNDLFISDSEQVVDSVAATENTKMKSRKRKKTNVNSIVGQAGLQQENITTVPSKSVASLVAPNPGKTVKARRYSKNTSRRKTNNNQLNSHLDEEASLLSTVTQENAIVPLEIDSSSSYRLKKLTKKAVTKIKDEAEQMLKVNHTEFQHKDLTSIPDPIISASSTKLTLKSKRPVKKTGRQKVKSNHGILLDTHTSPDTLNQADCVPTSFVFTTPPKKSKTIKKMSDIKVEAINTADDPTMPQQDISAVLQESDASIVPPKKRFRTLQTLNTDSSFNTTIEDYESVHLSKQTQLNAVNSVSTTETDCSHVFSQENTVRRKRPTKKVNRRKRRVIQAISSFEEQASPAVQEQNSALTIDINKNLTPEPHFDKDIVNETTEDHGERQVLVSTEAVASPQRKPKKNWQRQREKSEQELHQNSTATANSLSHEADKMSNLPPALESVSENFKTSEVDSCDQKCRVPRRKSKKSKEIAETHEFASVSLSQEALSPTKMKTEAVETDVMVTSTDVQDFSKLSDVQTVKGLKCFDKDGSEVDHKSVIIRQKPTIKGLKVTKARKTKKRKPAKRKRKIAGRSTQRIKEEEQRYTYSDHVIACDVQTQAKINDNSARTTVTQEEPVNSDVYISRKSTRIQKVVERKVDSTDITEDITEDITLSGSMNNSECKDLNDVHEISVGSEKKTPKRGRPRKHTLEVAHLEDNVTAPVQISDHPLCQSSTENNTEAAGNQVILEVVRRPKKRRGRKMKKKLTKVTKQLETDPSEPNDADQTDNNLSQSIPGRGRKRKKLKAPGRNLKLSSLKVTGRTSELGTGEAETSSLPLNSTEVDALLPRRGTRIKRKLDDRTTIQDEVAPSVEKIVEINFRKRGRRRQMVKELCFDDSETQPEQPHQSVSLLSKKKSPGQPLSFKDCFEVSLQSNTGACSEICGILPSNGVKEEEPEAILLDTKVKANTYLRSRKVPQNSSETEIVNTVSACQPSEVQKVNDKHVAIANKSKIGFNAKEKVKKPLTCKYCGVSFRHITAYVMHQRIHTGQKPYKCKSCGKTFAHLSKLKSHRNVHEQRDAFPCPCCNQTFMKKKELLCHFKVHLLETELSTQPKQNIKKKKEVSSKRPSNSSCHICKICDKNFVNQVKLQIHMRVHKAEMPLTCKDCGKTFRKPSSLAAHEKSHWPVKPYACSICGKGFSQLKALKKHSQDHTGDTPFSCSHCGHAFSALSALRMHQASKMCISKRTDGESCDIEGFIVSQEADGQVNTPVFFKCQICKQLFRKWCQYTLHLQTHTSSSPYLCFSCGQCYEKDSEVNAHCKVCCQSSGEEKTCEASVSEIMQGLTQTGSDLGLDSILKNTSNSLQSLPSSRFQNMQTRQKHTTFPPHPPEFEYTQTRTTTLPEKDAEQSPLKFPNAQSPARSEISCTSSDSPLECIEISPSLWKYQCSRCGQRFERYRMLCAHIQTHAPAFRYACTHCGQFFERWSKLWLHQRRHRRNGRCYSCTQCSLQFRFFNSYKEHMFDHAGQRPYACPLCPKTFIQEKSLHAHQYEFHKLCEHLKCDVCSKTFSSLRNLIKHSLLHNGSTSHVCLLCSISFTNTRALQQHLNTHTGYHGLPLPDIPSKPLSFPHKCRTCKACFSTGDLLYAHQICHFRDAKTKVRPESKSTSKSSDSRHTDEQSGTPLTLTNHVSKLKLDGVPNDKSLYVYSHPDRLYVNPSLSTVRHQVINLDCNELSDSQNTSQEISNSTPSTSSEGCTQDLPVLTSQSDSTHLPQDTSDRETTNLKTSGKDVTNNPIQNKKHSHKHQRRSTFVETSVNMEVETVHEEFEETFECADCTEKLTSVIGLYEHYILHAMGDTYVQVH